MGLKTGSKQKTWLSIREGKIATRDGDKFILHDSIEGYLVGMNTRDGKYGIELHLQIEDGNELYDLTIPIKDHPSPGKNPTQTSYFRAFAHLAPNINVARPVEIIPSLKIINDKKQSTLFINQDGETLRWAFKKGDGVMPEAEEVRNKKGEVITIDWDAVETFRVDKVNELNDRIKQHQARSSEERFLEGAPENNDGAWKKAYEAPVNTFGSESESDGPQDKAADLPF